MKHVTGIFLILSFLGSLSFASDDCSNIDVRKSMNPSLQKRFYAPYDQGQIGWCFGYAAADVLSQAVGEPVSAIHLSSRYASTVTGVGRLARSIFMRKNAVSEGGFIEGAIDEMEELGHYCEASAVPSEGTMVISARDGVTGYNVLGTAELMGYLKSYSEGTCTEDCAYFINPLIRRYFPNQDVNVVKEYILANKTQPLDRLVFELFDQKCGQGRKAITSKFAIESYQNSTSRNKRRDIQPQEEISDHIDQGLNAQKVVGLEYDAKYVTGAGGIFGGGHASTILGRKSIGGVCHYLVRNSWGKTCAYKDGIICQPGDGTYWVPKETMNKMATKVLWIKN
ncbi:hypothetical protein [Bdellovibrio sp. NC01]|uniref:hypothetical protein n=1 Tax=Bdellovibrio sp. NC01 TaxID=2220073 RepID=UPI00115974D6|nr:hypothetical protein [Bdellovibrio sp. NC01]QDK36915.1 hypothetical protein DOE51_04565 [Bdellovibrio sp. NC01]